jgi:hypothetical protein
MGVSDFRLLSFAVPEAGYVPNKGHSADHSGHGWNVVMTLRGHLGGARVRAHLAAL